MQLVKSVTNSVILLKSESRKVFILRDLRATAVQLLLFFLKYKDLKMRLIIKNGPDRTHGITISVCMPGSSIAGLCSSSSKMKELNICFNIFSSSLFAPETYVLSIPAQEKQMELLQSRLIQ